MGKLGNFEGIEKFETNQKNKIESIPSVTENDRKKLAHQGDNKISESILSNPKSEMDSENKKISDGKERLSKKETNRDLEKQGDLVQSGTVRENPKYGKGGGEQFFIRNAGNQPLREDGKIPLKHGYLEKIGEEKLQHNDLPNNSVTKNRNITSELKTPTVLVDSAPLSKSEQEGWKQLDKNTSATPNELPENKNTVKNQRKSFGVDNTPLSKSEQEEWKQLDEHTRPTRDLPKVVKNDKNQNLKESYNYAHSNQENLGMNQDAFKPSRKLKNGDVLYQLRSADNDKTSNYFTSADTVDKCRKKNGDVDTKKLLDALQIDPRGDNEWILRKYVYHNK